MEERSKNKVDETIAPSEEWIEAKKLADQRDARFDLGAALDFLQKGADRGDPNCVADLGRAYEFALGAPYDFKKARAMYERALEMSPNFERRGFALCRLANLRALKVSESVVVSQGKLGKETVYRPNLCAKDPGDQARVEEIFSECDPGDDPFFALDLAKFVREEGQPVKDAEILAARLEKPAIAELKKLASEGDGLAAWYLVDVHGSGRCVRKNDAKAIKYLRQAGLYRCAPALVAIGRAYENRGVNKVARKMYQAAADLDEPDGLCEAGLMELVEGEREKALEYFERGSALEHAPSQFFLGKCLWEEDFPISRERAVELWKKSAEQGFELAMERYAMALEATLTPNSSNREWSLCADYYRRAAEAGMDASKVAYALLLRRGLGVRRDLDESDRLLREIEASGDAESKEFYGEKKLEGTICKRDVEGGLRLLQEASKERPSALVALGFHFYLGDVVERDYLAAADLFEKAAAQDNVIGLINFARCCFEGLGVLRDDAAGEYFLRKAAAMGDPVAAGRLAAFYADGAFGEVNWTAARQWYFLASMRGDPNATERLAYCHWYGLGGAQDRLLGAHLWEQAARFGDEFALEEQNRAKLALKVDRAVREPEIDDEFRKYVAAEPIVREWLETRKIEDGATPNQFDFVERYQEIVSDICDGKIPLPTNVDSRGGTEALKALFDAYYETVEANPFVDPTAAESE